MEIRILDKCTVIEYITLHTFMTSLRAPSPANSTHAAAPPTTPLYLQETTVSPAPTPEPDAEPESSSNNHDQSVKAKIRRLSFLPTSRDREEHDADDRQLVPEYTPHLRDALLMALNPFHVRLILANTGSVARDHLSLERTFLSYVRTSLAMASAGVGKCSVFLDDVWFTRDVKKALVQLFSSSQNKTSDGSSGAATHVIRPLGSVMVIYGLVVLVMGSSGCFYKSQSLLKCTLDFG